MKYNIEKYQDEFPVKATELSDWLLARGIGGVTTEQVARILHIPTDQVRQRLATPAKKNRFCTPSRGLWIPVPPEYTTWGAPEPAAYLDLMMDYLDANYYVGWLSAAEIHGASHQAPQVFQVATNKRIDNRIVGRSNLRFCVRDSVSSIPAKRMAFPSGVMQVSTPGATMLDIMEDIDLASGLDNAVTVVVELARENEGFIKEAAEAARFHSVSAVRRVGWALDAIGGLGDLGQLEKAAQEKTKYPSLLYPYGKRTAAVNKRWHINVNRKVDPDL